MKYIKTFENWAGPTLPTTSLDVLYNYILCKDCNALYRIYKPKSTNCKYCGSKNISDISEDDYYNELKLRIDDPEEWSDIIKDREDTKNTFIDLSIDYDKRNFIN